IRAQLRDMLSVAGMQAANDHIVSPHLWLMMVENIDHPIPDAQIRKGFVEQRGKWLCHIHKPHNEWGQSSRADGIRLANQGIVAGTLNEERSWLRPAIGPHCAIARVDHVRPNQLTW